MQKKTDNNLSKITLKKNHTYEKGSGCLTRLATQGWSLLNEEVSFPIAVIKENSVINNARWMQEFSDKSTVKLAPHGKTTMAPELFKLQLEQGCWGISLATVPQVVNAYNQGVTRIILANQLVGAFHFKVILDLLTDNKLEFYCFVDSIENAIQLGQYFTDKNISLNILIEIGIGGGRCGWRDVNSINQLIDVIRQFPCLRLCGISFYEGVIHGENAEQKIKNFINDVVKLTANLYENSLFYNQQVMITGAGSSWYDVVSEQLMLQSDIAQEHITAIIRPGCYLIHDTGIYQQAQQSVITRSQLACDVSGELVTSLELWAYVYSVPEVGLAIIGLGKRDVAFDAGLPTPEYHYRPGTAKPIKVKGAWQVTQIMDQHCMMKISDEASLNVGDLVCFSTSHPCLTMDKWRKVGVVNEAFVVHKTIDTYF